MILYHIIHPFKVYNSVGLVYSPSHSAINHQFWNLFIVPKQTLLLPLASSPPAALGRPSFQPLGTSSPGHLVELESLAVSSSASPGHLVGLQSLAVSSSVSDCSHHHCFQGSLVVWVFSTSFFFSADVPFYGCATSVFMHLLMGIE